jgi:PAS domain S-box-containing protein
MSGSDTPGTITTIAGDAEALQRYARDIARERDDVYRKLREREADLARIQRIGRVGGVEVNFNDGFQNRRSPEYLIIHGLPPDATHETHEDWVARIHPEDRERTVAQFLAALKNGTQEDYTCEYRIVRPSDRQVRWIGVTAKIERDASGRAIRLVGAHIDITDRMLAQESLRESEERFRLIANSAPVPMWVTRLDGQRAFANQAYLDFLGLPYEQAVVFDWRKALHPDDLSRIVQEQIAGESSLKPFVLEARYRRADGEWRWLRSESQPRLDPMGRHIGFIGVAHDVTASKTAETELRHLNESLEDRIGRRTAQLEHREAQMRTILETSNQYQGLLDADGRVIFANKTSLAGIRAKASDVVGKPLWDTAWFAGTDCVGDTIRDAFERVKTGETVRLEVRLTLPVGHRSFDFAMRPVFEQQRVSSVLMEAVDITERLQGEEALRQSQKMEAVGQLTGGVAHDFNNLLTIIRSATDILRRRDLPEDRRRRYVDAISDTVDRASKLTSQLLAFARRQPLKPQVFDVRQQVESVAELIRPLVGSRIRIDVEVEGSSHFATADIAQFETAIINLAVNGRDAMDNEGVLAIKVAEVRTLPPLRGFPARDGDYIAISVTDSGTGIAPDQLETIFEPFFTTKEVGKGTGLGLSQAFGFAKQSGGDIAVTSQPGHGATFTIYLPQASAPTASDDRSTTHTQSDARGGGHRVLVVEDNLEVGRFSTTLLEDLGYTITLATDAKSALAVLADQPTNYDLVFSDVIMPGMNGVELGTIIRSRYPGLPVVLTSGYSDVMAENADRGFELIQKPYSVETLSHTLRRAIMERKPALS